jgi:hypothetical protein
MWRAGMNRHGTEVVPDTGGVIATHPRAKPLLYSPEP